MRLHYIDFISDDQVIETLGQKEKIGHLETYLLKQRKKTYFKWSLLFLLLAVMGYGVEFDLIKIFQGLPSMAELIQRMLKPNIKYIYQIGPALIETIRMTLIASFIGVAIAVPIALVIADNTAPIKGLARFLQIFFALLRTIPSLIWAALLVSLFSVGLFSGIMALMLVSILIAIKLLREAVETINENTLLSFYSLGAGKIAFMRQGILPIMKEKIVSVFFITVETNMRNAAVLGLVGAGGIGQLLWKDLNHLRYDNVAMIVLAMFLMIILTDFFCTRARQYLTNYSKNHAHIGAYKSYKYRERCIKFLIFMLLIIRVKTFLTIDSKRLSLGLEQAYRMLSRMLDIEVAYAPKVLGALVESASIAIFATIVGGIIAWGLSYHTALNMAPRRGICWIYKGFSNILRTFPPMIMAIIFFRGVGAGPLAGALALSLYTAGILLKMYSEYLEHLSEELVQGLLVTGCSPRINFIKSIWPNTAKQFWSLLFYRLESNIRTSTVLGIIGAGGVGSLLTNNIMWRNWERVGMLILGSSILIISIDFLSGKIRRVFN